MSEYHATVGIFSLHTQAETAVNELQRNGLNIRKLSIVGRDQRTEEHVMGYYTSNDRMMCWGNRGAFWGGVWGLLVGAGFFWVPGVGPLLLAGLVAMIVGAVLVGGLSAFGAGLYGMGVPKNTVLKYKTAVKNGDFIVVFHGTAEESEKARQILITAKALDAELFVKQPVVEV